MDVTLKVRRYDPEAENAASYWQEFPVSIEDNATVLDALIKVREDVDGTLSLRCSCRSSICGSCAMRVNGHACLACKTQAVQAVDATNTIVVEPAGVMPVIKDLVVDFNLFWDKIVEVEPYLQPHGDEPEEEYIASNESMLHLSDVTGCIMCGACVSDCTVLEVDPTFLGPAALAKAYRFTADPRDGDANGVSKERLERLSEATGIWDCTRCYECVQVCPKGVAPMDRIMALREQAMAEGLTNNTRLPPCFCLHRNYWAQRLARRATAHPKDGWTNQLTSIDELLACGPAGSHSRQTALHHPQKHRRCEKRAPAGQGRRGSRTVMV